MSGQCTRVSSVGVGEMRGVAKREGGDGGGGGERDGGETKRDFRPSNLALLQLQRTIMQNSENAILLLLLDYLWCPISEEPRALTKARIHSFHHTLTHTHTHTHTHNTDTCK